MSRVSIDFNIETEGRKQSFETEGVLLDDTLVFRDEKDQKHTIEISDESLHYLRGGDPAFDFVFEEGTLHKGDYQVGSQNLTFDIQTHSLVITLNAIELTYTLRQGDVVINHSKLSLMYDKMQEA